MNAQKADLATLIAAANNIANDARSTFGQARDGRERLSGLANMYTKSTLKITKGTCSLLIFVQSCGLRKLCGKSKILK